MSTAFDSGMSSIFDGLVVFWLSIAGGQLAREEDGHRLIEKAGAGVEIQGALPLSRAIAGLFQQLALARSQRRLAWIDAAGWQFPQIIARRVAILVFSAEPEVRLRSRRQRAHHRSRMPNDITPGRDAGRLRDFVGGNFEHFAFVNNFRRQDLKTILIRTGFGWSALPCHVHQYS